MEILMADGGGSGMGVVIGVLLAVGSALTHEGQADANQRYHQ